MVLFPFVAVKMAALTSTFLPVPTAMMEAPVPAVVNTAFEFCDKLNTSPLSKPVTSRLLAPTLTLVVPS